MSLLTSVRRALLVLCLVPALLVPGGLRACLCVCEGIRAATESRAESTDSCCARSEPTNTPMVAAADECCAGCCRVIHIKPIDTAQPGPHSLDGLPHPELALAAPAFFAAPKLRIESAVAREPVPRVLDRFDLRLTLRI
jgi:hypothetical protein